MCQCRKCKKSFHQDEIVREDKEDPDLHITITERKCPHCGSTKFGLINYPISEKELIYKNKSFFGLSNARSKYIEQYNEFKEAIDELYI